MNPNQSGRLATILTVSVLWSQGCESGGKGEGDVAEPAQPTSFLALGDSYTIGESVDSTLRWPVQLAGLLRAEGTAVMDPLIIARTGWTTDELAAGIREEAPGGPYGMVSLLIGVNNQYRGRELEEYREQFLALLSQAVSFAGGEPSRVLVLSIPDWGVMPFARDRDRETISRDIDAFNQVNREESVRSGARYVDVTGISRTAGSNPSLVAEDGLHPSGVQYALWAGAALPVANQILAPER
jgi:lysophospholipase L1-like esterase